MSPDRARHARRLLRVAFAIVLGLQVFLAVWGVADQWTRGHNGWNGAAYQNAARNTLRWDVLFPLQYETANVPPKPDQVYTHAPLALHLNNVVSVTLFGDRELSIRLVAGFWSVAALCMLFAVVRRLWGDGHAILASAVYVLLPINAIYTNMANHSAGFIFWSLLTLYLYIRRSGAPVWRGADFALFAGSFGIAATWDWPAYYIAFAIALHWALTLLASRGGEPNGGSPKQLLGFCAWVLLLFFGHFALADLAAGNLDELRGAFNARRALSWSRFRTHLLVVPELMFTVPILGLCAAWVVGWAIRLARRSTSARELLPAAFFFAGFLHYWTFRWSAVVHSYWAWPLLPAVAIAVAVTVFAAARWIRARFGPLASYSVFLLLIPLLIRSAELVPAGRYVGGSMWFVAPVRGALEPYDSGRAELRFAERVKAWTDRDTGVQLHTSLKERRLEPRFDITLDRVTHRWAQNPREQIANDEGVDGWVFVAAIDAFDESERVALAARHPYRQFGSYFMLDLRREGRAIEAWGLTPFPYTPRWRLFHSSFEPPARASRLIGVEQTLNRKVAELDAR